MGRDKQFNKGKRKKNKIKESKTSDTNHHLQK